LAFTLAFFYRRRPGDVTSSVRLPGCWPTFRFFPICTGRCFFVINNHRSLLLQRVFCLAAPWISFDRIPRICFALSNLHFPPDCVNSHHCSPPRPPPAVSNVFKFVPSLESLSRVTYFLYAVSFCSGLIPGLPPPCAEFFFFSYDATSAASSRVFTLSFVPARKGFLCEPGAMTRTRL